ncbi:sugar phosphate isomerase/epimerase [Streptomyces sp. TLI_146]|uniref:sugar phosphate isomerase/epimerase family protein n=1 Tax=Streptomyces sp. TLI_146 TaxID=1938858 RepID=UPI000C704D45|nr:sugar phosphate isomerase/epimerase [Streptomyces sp. TLI_146]PKV82692.1 sugar phosphate isomerase/epimerase [Streptomyces sp. TLI_146]
MKLCLNRATIAATFPHPLVARTAAQSGFRFLDMPAVQWLSALDDDPGLRAVIADGLTPLHSPWTLKLGWDEDRFEAGLHTAAGQMAAMSAFGSRSGSLVLPRFTTRRTPLSTAQLQDRIGRTGALAARHGLDLVLKFIGVGAPTDQGVRSLPEALTVVQGLGYNIGILLDTYHWHASNGTLAQIHQIPPGMPLLVQISDAPDLPRPLLTNAMRTLPGDGVINWPDLLTALNEHGYHGPLSITVKPRLHGRDVIDAVRAAHQAGQAVLAHVPLAEGAVR